ncbi:MAG: peptide chain release factor 2 [Candidatus Aminicenantes bacterium]|nr:peptide chain release factor 2 [Candidatus Aminicenantes bacterium]MDH5466035.1 peptide chain release factor 2 [Candidatus Aminicenantes bacterium]MDH5704990.1 peptide chain release factor 2 [Candidatus Aminicenantes bacterium]
MKEKESLPKLSHSDLLVRIKECLSAFEDLRGIFDLDQKKAEYEKINQELSSPDTWKDRKKSQSLQQNKKRLEREMQFLSRLYREKEELEVLLELAEEGENVDQEISQSLDSFEKDFEEANLQTLFFEEDDIRNAILTIHPGAGGTESQDWAQMLLRMYLRYAERKDYKTEILDYLPGEEAGLKSATVRVQGDYAYGNLSQESGVHRLVRISPFDANKRRHTSFAAVFVYPEVEEDIEVEINPEDLRIDTFRASGRGGQHVNVTDSAVRITHIPTGIVVQCQNERSQHKNKASAMKVLKARLYELEKKAKLEKLEKLEDAKSDIAWGNQIRSYVLHPYRMIKDLRTGEEIGDTESVLDGEIDEFIKSNLIARKPHMD